MSLVKILERPTTQIKDCWLQCDQQDYFSPLLYSVVQYLYLHFQTILFPFTFLCHPTLDIDFPLLSPSVSNSSLYSYHYITSDVFLCFLHTNQEFLERQKIDRWRTHETKCSFKIHLLYCSSAMLILTLVCLATTLVNRYIIISSTIIFCLYIFLCCIKP